MVNNGFEAAAFSPYCHFAAFSGRKRLVPAGASARRTVAELQKTLYRIFGRCSQRVLCGQLGFELHPPASSPAPSPPWTVGGWRRHAAYGRAVRRIPFAFTLRVRFTDGYRRGRIFHFSVARALRNGYDSQKRG